MGGRIDEHLAGPALDNLKVHEKGLAKYFRHPGVLGPLLSRAYREKNFHVLAQSEMTNQPRTECDFKSIG